MKTLWQAKGCVGKKKKLVQVVENENFSTVFINGGWKNRSASLRKKKPVNRVIWWMKLRGSGEDHQRGPKGKKLTKFGPQTCTPKRMQVAFRLMVVQCRLYVINIKSYSAAEEEYGFPQSVIVSTSRNTYFHFQTHTECMMQ